MAETTLETPPVESAPSTPPGMARFMADVSAPPAPVTPEPKAEPTPEPVKPATPAKPDVKTVVPPKDESKVAQPKASDKPKPQDNNQLRQRLEELSKSEKAKTKEATDLANKIKELEAKRFYSEEDDKKVQAAEQRIADLQKQLSESAYERSDDFKSKFIEPYNNTLTRTISMVEAMSIAVGEEGQTRKATRGDFMRVANLPVEEQAQVAQDLFGVNAVRVLTQIDKLQDMRQQADTAITNHRSTVEAKTRESQLTQAQEQKIYQETRSTARQALVEEYPQFFADDPNDPEATTKVQEGNNFVEQLEKTIPGMSVTDRAMANEVLMARAGPGFTRLAYENTKLRQELESVKAEMKKLKGTDPGAETKGDVANGEPEKSTTDIPTGGLRALIDDKIWDANR